MKKDEFKEAVKGLVYVFINNQDMLGKDAHLRVNPELLTIDVVKEQDCLAGLADSEEVIEDAAYAHGAETEDASDYQASQDPDYYPMKTLVMKDAEGQSIPDDRAIEELAKNYFE